MDTTIFVTGATGNQGGAVARHLLFNNFKVKALTRHQNSEAAVRLQKAGAEVVQGDLNDPSSFKKHLQDVAGLFSVQTFTDGTEKEIKQGKMLIDLSKEYNIPHFVYASVKGADLSTGIPHWESKFIIENYLKKSGISYTILRPSSLFENFLIPDVCSRILKGKLVSPINKDIRQQFISADDIGKIVVKVFSDSLKYKDQVIELASEEMDQQQAAAVFSEVLGKKITYQKLPMIITRLVMGKDLYKMFRWINRNLTTTSTQQLLAFNQAYPDSFTLKKWVQSKFIGEKLFTHQKEIL
ncbi:NmrA/HSCARG family protein [soil metagenome]